MPIAQMAPGFAVLTALAALLLSSPGARAADVYDWQWRTGRATAFGDDGHGSYCRPENHDITCWSINKGNCAFGFVGWPGEPTGLDVAALSDQAWDFAGSCGRCYEVRCDPAWVKDGFGTSYDRTHTCRDASTSLVVRTVDSCACTYAANPVSNKRWCCQGYHLDLSIWAFEKLADHKWGVIGVQYRAVPCTYKPPKPAPALANPTPAQPAPAGEVDPLKAGVDPSPKKKWSSQQSNNAYQPGGISSVVASSGPSQVLSQVVSQSQAQRQGQSQGQSQSVSQSASQSVSQGKPTTIFYQALQSGWWDRSWSSKVTWAAGKFGPNGETVACGTISGSGALAVGHAPGAFQGMADLELWVKTDKGVPYVTINLVGQAGSCTALGLAELPAVESKGGFSKLWVPLAEFAGAQGSASSGGASFGGCGGMGVWDLNSLELRSVDGAAQTLCLSSIRLLPGP